MKFLCDENIPRTVSAFLASLPKTKVRNVAEEQLQGVPDARIVAEALTKREIVVTLDKDFLAFGEQELKIIYLKFPRTAPTDIIPFLEAAVRLLLKHPRKSGFVTQVSRQTVTILPRK